VTITRADEVDSLAVAEVVHTLRRTTDPLILEQIKELLDDPITLERIALNHSSLLVRMLAQRLVKPHF
jgi:hypothetical protein